MSICRLNHKFVQTVIYYILYYMFLPLLAIIRGIYIQKIKCYQKG